MVRILPACSGPHPSRAGNPQSFQLHGGVATPFRPVSMDRGVSPSPLAALRSAPFSSSSLTLAFAPCTAA